MAAAYTCTMYELNQDCVTVYAASAIISFIHFFRFLLRLRFYFLLFVLNKEVQFTEIHTNCILCE